MDEPVFFAEDTSEVATHFDVPAEHQYIGKVDESSIDPEMPTIYLQWEVAKRLQFEGQRSIQEDLEVAGILLGTRSADDSVIKVSHIAVAKDEDSSPVHFKFSYSVWDDLIDQMEEMSNEAGEELLLLGWYHTHPNMAVFLSRYDLRTHRDFARPYQFALVLAPRVGTSQTAVGFFCNRGEGTPLLPGLRLYDVTPGDDVGRALPWGFQDLEAEGVYEGEGETEDDGADTQDDDPEVAQLGVVRMEDPDWLTLGEDLSEGAVLPILEGMAAAVVETKKDRIGVLLGTKTADNHITINRVRFLGTMRDDPDGEREDILGALRFMSASFPAHNEQKILGVCRIVSPHRFRRGDAYDPCDHNIRIALLLGDVGYDLDQVPFQVGIALYPGIEEDTLFFQVFAQHKTSRPVPLMSMRALAPPSMRANERYEPVDGPIFNVDEDPCHEPPTFGARKKAQDDEARKSSRAIPIQSQIAGVALGTPSARGDYVDPTTTGVDWDAIEDDRAGEKKGGVPLLLVGMGIASVVILIGLLTFMGKNIPDDGSGEDVAPAGEPIVLEGEPYNFSLTGCGAGWNPTRACAPFADPESPDKVELVRVQRLPAYDSATFEPLEAWLLPKVRQDRPKVRLDRRADGDNWIFSVLLGQARWEDFWGEGDTFQATLVLVPHGAELRGGDELEPLRRTQELLLAGPTERDSEPSPRGPDRGSEGDEDEPQPTSDSTWLWKATQGGQHSAVYDRHRTSFTSPLFVEGEGDGRWSIELRDGTGATLGSKKSQKVVADGSRTDLRPALQGVLRSPKIAAALAGIAGDSPRASLLLTPPGSRDVLELDVTLRGAAKLTVQHKVCVMALREDGEPLATISEQSKVVGEYAVNPTDSRSTMAPREAFATGTCSDGGNSSRWVPVEFGPGQMQLTFRYTGKEEFPFKNIARAPVPATWYVPGAEPSCLTFTVTLNAGGVQSRAPKIEQAYSLAGGRCQ